MTTIEESHECFGEECWNCHDEYFGDREQLVCMIKTKGMSQIDVFLYVRQKTARQ
jgi:hypothetical protein